MITMVWRLVSPLNPSFLVSYKYFEILAKRIPGFAGTEILALFLRTPVPATCRYIVVFT